jgi:hypothetical protein
VKPPNGGFANWSAAADRNFSKSPTLVPWGRKALLHATSAAAAERFESMAWMNALLSQLSPLYRNTIQRDWPLKDGDDPGKWGSKIASGLSAWRAPARHEDAAEFLAAVDVVEMFDQNLGRIERLDAMIDRTIKRLVQIKTMKQKYRQLQPKLVTGRCTTG